MSEVDRESFPFDWKLDKNTRMPESFRTALIHVNDTLEFAVASAQQNFRDKAMPEHALAICQMIMAENGRLVRTEEERRRTSLERDEGSDE